MVALAVLFFAEAQRAFFTVLFGLVYEAVYPAVQPAAVLLAVLPVALVLSAPLLPLARWMDHRGAIAAALAGVAVFRVPMSLPEFAARGLGSTLVLASAAMFLAWGLGQLGRRTVASGLVLGLVADQLLRLAGSSWDLSLRPAWLPVQALLSLVLLALVVLWLRAAEEPAAAAQGSGGTGPGIDASGRLPGAQLERRAGGLRLRGALALGVLLFLDLHLLGLPVVAARWTGASYGTAALATSIAGALALGAVIARRWPVRARAAALALVLVVGLALLIGWQVPGSTGAVALACGHLAALLLMVRAVEPARGRRGRGVVPAGMLVFVAFVALYGASYFHAFLTPALQGAAPWVMGAAVLMLAVMFVLLPQLDVPTGPPRLLVAAGATAAVIALGLLVGPDAPARPDPDQRPYGAEQTQLRVGTYNIHYGFDEQWRFDPGAIAAAIRDADPDVIVLQEVAAGLPMVSGVDLPLWLGQKLGVRAEFAPVTARLQGEAYLARAPARLVRATRLQAGGGAPKQVLHLEAVLAGQRLDLFAVHLGVDPGAGRPQIREVLRSVPVGRAVLLGDLNAEAGSAVTDALAEAGFTDAFVSAGSAPAATWPSASPERRLDWIWLRGVNAVSAAVSAHHASDHRLVVATLRQEDETR